MYRNSYAGSGKNEYFEHTLIECNKAEMM